MKRLPISAAWTSVNVFAVLIGITAFVWPDARKWCLHHAGVGWLVAIAFGVLALAAVNYIVVLRSRIPSDTDARLLREWLDGWTQGGDFMRWVDAFSGFRMSYSQADEIDQRLEKWRLDRRQLKNRGLRNAFAEVKAAAQTFSDMITDFMFLEGDKMEIPREWKREQPERYDKGYKALSKTSTQLRDALAALFAKMHALGIEPSAS